MTSKSTLARHAIATATAAALLSGFADSASAQGQGYGVGEWNLITQGGASVCHVVLTSRLVPQQNAFQAFSRGGARCIDWRVRNLGLWVVRGNDLSLVDTRGAEIAKLAEQGPNQYAQGEWTLQRIGTGYAPPRPGYPSPGYPASPGYPPNQGYPPPTHGQGPDYEHGVGEWRLINRATRSVCHLSLTRRPLPQYNAYRAVAQGGERCTDWVGQQAAVWVVRGNTLSLADRNGRELAKLGQQSTDEYAGGEWVLRRARWQNY